MSDARVRPALQYAWKGPSLLIVNSHGECGADEGLSGFFYREARFLRTLALEINGKQPWLCEAAAVSPDRLAFTLVHPDVESPGGGGTGHSDDVEHLDADGLPERALDIRLEFDIRLDRLEVGLAITNRSLRPLVFAVAWRLDADYADIQEAQTGKREQNAAVRARPQDNGIELTYDHADLPYRTRIEASGTSWRSSAARIDAEVRLEPQQALVSTLRVIPSGTRVVLDEEGVRVREVALAGWRDRFTQIEATGRTDAERAIADNVRDIASFPQLDGESDEWLAPQAGMPLYPAFFGRDGLTAGWQTALLDRGELLDASMARLARMQSSRVDDWRDEEPGRLPYQVRQGPLALLNVNPYSAYYADFASPLMFVVSLANLYAWTGDMTCVDRYWDTARRILDWARRDGDKDRDGYLEYLTRSPKGTKNQGWKDSGDAIVYMDGSPVPAPIATCEIQAYWYIAQELMGTLCWLRGEREDAAEHYRNAASLKERFNRDWWVDESNCFAMALDPDKQRVAGATSNVGHCIACGIIDADHLPKVVGTLFAPDMFSGWGIRTLSSDHVYYNPISYHRGTVWAVEQATIAFGLRRFGFDARALDLVGAMFDLASLYAEHRIPECIGGYPRRDGTMPGAYPQANTPQLWNATVFPLLVQTVTGVLPLAPFETLVIDPVLPEWLPGLTLSRLRVGNATVSLRCWRDENGHASWEVLHKSGTLHVIRQPPPESLSAGLGDRMRAAWESLRG
jgi:glycogen debranching enzyme